MNTHNAIHTSVSLGYTPTDSLHGTLTHLLTYYSFMGSKVGYGGTHSAIGSKDTDVLSIDTFSLIQEDCGGKVLVSMNGVYKGYPISLLFSFEGEDVVVDCNIKDCNTATISDMIGTIQAYLDANPFQPEMLDYVASL